MTEEADRRTLDELDPPAWDPPEAGDTPMVKRCIRLRSTPLVEWELDDLRLMIGQQISPAILMPRAIEILDRNPLTDAGNYPGDLLHVVMTVDKSYWHQHAEQWQDVDGIVSAFISAYEDVAANLDAFRYGVRTDSMPPD